MQTSRTVISANVIGKEIAGLYLQECTSVCNNEQD